jgi:hypothetical protein
VAGNNAPETESVVRTIKNTEITFFIESTGLNF